MSADECGQEACANWAGDGCICRVMGIEPEVVPTINITITPRPPKHLMHPCDVGQHRWAWQVDGRQACGYCGRMRR